MRIRSFRVVVALVLSTAVVGLFAAPAVAVKKPAETAGFDGSTINLGVITPESGIASVIGKPLTAGNQMFWDYYNAEKGGIGGKYKVELKVEDSAYQAATAVSAYDTLKGDVVAFQQILGSQITQALLPKMQADQAVGGPATLDGTWVHNPNLMPIVAPYQIEVINALDYYVKNGGKGKTVCALAQDDEFGEAALQGLAAAKKSLKLKTGPTTRFNTGEDLTGQIQQLSDAKCDAVLVASTPLDTSSIMTKAISANFEPQFIALAPAWLTSLAKSANIAQYITDHLWISSSQFAAWGDTTVPGMQTFLDRQAQYAPSQTPDGYFVFGYIQAQAMAQILEKAVKNGDLSRAGILKAMNQVGTLKFEDLETPYKYGKSAADRNPPRATTLFQVDASTPVGLAVLSPQAASAAAKKYKFK
jgi:ABC-type branched-subunit amino acid transport system substrate-binding protein